MGREGGSGEGGRGRVWSGGGVVGGGKREGSWEWVVTLFLIRFERLDTSMLLQVWHTLGGREGTMQRAYGAGPAAKWGRSIHPDRA